MTLPQLLLLPSKNIFSTSNWKYEVPFFQPRAFQIFTIPKFYNLEISISTITDGLLSSCSANSRHQILFYRSGQLFWIIKTPFSYARSSKSIRIFHTIHLSGGSSGFWTKTHRHSKMSPCRIPKPSPDTVNRKVFQ